MKRTLRISAGTCYIPLYCCGSAVGSTAFRTDIFRIVFTLIFPFLFAHQNLPFFNLFFISFSIIYFVLDNNENHPRLSPYMAKKSFFFHSPFNIRCLTGWRNCLIAFRITCLAPSGVSLFLFHTFLLALASDPERSVLRCVIPCGRFPTPKRDSTVLFFVSVHSSVPCYPKPMKKLIEADPQ